ncbi:MAG: fused MFS/spermidine synthase, partial [Clostridia bacterium]|nr:fused MFS/spermidine synthase [Clostridia bacterium]
MAVELGASRLLAPYFSSSQIIWTIIIGTIMIAMALGNVWGGRLADKKPDPAHVYGRILIAGVWIALIPVVGKYIIAGISLLLALFVKAGFLVWASLLSCLILFVFPLMLLGSVSPAIVKFTMSSPDKSGTTVGELNALNTIGSIIGTFAPTFITIPTVGTSISFFIFAAILIIIAAAYFFFLREKMKKSEIIKTSVCLALVAACGFGSTFGSFAFWQNDLVYEGESVYNYLQIYDSANARYFSTNVLFGVQSMQMKDGGLTGGYYDYDLAAPLMAGIKETENPEDFDILILGLATGTFATQCLKYYGNVNVEGVEIDGKIAKLAREYFNLPDAVKVTVSDGRAYIFSGEGKNKKYDVILVDAYQDITIPFQMSSKEFFTLVSERLKEDGVMALNMNMFSDDVNSINAYIADTVAAVFPEVYYARIEDNRELFASKNADMIEKFERGLNEVPADLKTSLTFA